MSLHILKIENVLLLNIVPDILAQLFSFLAEHLCRQICINSSICCLLWVIKVALYIFYSKQNKKIFRMSTLNWPEWVHRLRVNIHKKNKNFFFRHQRFHINSPDVSISIKKKCVHCCLCYEVCSCNRVRIECQQYFANKEFKPILKCRKHFYYNFTWLCALPSDFFTIFSLLLFWLSLCSSFVVRWKWVCHSLVNNNKHYDWKCT